MQTTLSRERSSDLLAMARADIRRGGFISYSTSLELERANITVAELERRLLDQQEAA